ncbi:MAG: YkgJ family cysteine cluster protein [Porticoccus sp.]|nr:YkgJ family cysteine cluster protein [Porticoccus sp.]MBQ0807291.1 YkgJ family cysteine cluster protein [Porticoccus sp.]
MKDCNQCGKCCVKYSNGGLSVSESEIELWELFKPDIYQYVSNGKIWVDPKTGEQIERCPWLRKEPNQEKYTCDIYYDRPDDCKFYPVTIEQMVKDECEMLEERDLDKPKQAQVALDKLMVDSRPSVK